MTTFIDTHPLARKGHRCGLCGRTIQPGETYRRGVGLDGGTAWTWKECAHCNIAHVIPLKETGDCEYGPDLLIEWEPTSWQQMRVKVQYLRQWRRADGSLYSPPDLIRCTTKSGFGVPVDVKAGTP